MTELPSSSHPESSEETDNVSERMSQGCDQSIETNTHQCIARRDNQTHSNNTSTSVLSSPDPGMVDNDEEKVKPKDGDDVTYMDIGMRFGTAPITMKRNTDSDVFPHLAAKQPQQRDPLCSTNASPGQATCAPAREDGDAVHCHRTFLLGCSVSTLKEMAACSRNLNQSPLKIAHGNTFIAMSDVNITSLLEHGSALSPKGAVDVSSLFESGGSIARELLDAFNRYRSAHPGPDNATDGSLASEMAAHPCAEVTTETATEVTSQVVLDAMEPMMPDESAAVSADAAGEMTTEADTPETSETVAEMAPEAAAEMASEVTAHVSLGQQVAACVLLDMMESVVPDETTAVSADVVGEMALEAAAEMAHEVATPVASGQMTERAPQIIPDIVVEMVSDVFIPIASETPTEMVPKTDKKMSSEFEAYMASEVLVPIKKEMELTASAMLIPLEFEMKKPIFSERYGAEPTASEEKTLVTPEMKAESPPEVKEQMTPELAETIISVAENPITSEPMATAAASEMETSMAAETPEDMTPVISDTMVFMASETSFSETSVVMESDTSEVVEQTVSEVETGMASQEKMSVASEMDGVMASEGITISVPEKKLVVPEMTVVTLALPGEEEMSSMKAPTVETTPEADTSSSQLVEEPKASKTSKKGVKQVKKQTATKRTRKAVQPKAKRNSKTKNSATESEPISIDSGDDANIPYNFEDSTVSYDTGDDVVVETGTKDQLVTKPENVGEATPLSKTATPFNNTTNTRKRHKTGPGAISSERQKKSKSQQADVCQAGASSDGDAEAGSCVPCLPLESITSLLRQLAGSKSNDKPEVDPQCPLQIPSEVLQDYSFVICQCDVKKNQNTYFICQVLQTSAEEAYVWYRCGRMGQVATKSLMGPISPHIAAIVEFTRMYQNKTGHNWFWSSVDERRRPKVDSYGELDIDYSQTKLETTDSTLRSYIQTAYDYVRNIVYPDQEVNTAECQNSLLGRLSMAQVLKGYDLLEELEQIVKKSRMKAQLWALSSKYYATIPHDVGKERLSNIETTSKIEQERKFLLTEFVLPVLS